jgi:hypothetical protein
MLAQPVKSRPLNTETKKSHRHPRGAHPHQLHAHPPRAELKSKQGQERESWVQAMRIADLAVEMLKELAGE